jgi:pimeloyl-ACP methyl ester carboxylesterase
MGAAISARLAQRQPPACLILESAFTSVPDRAAELYWWLPIRWLLHLDMNTREYVADSDVPTLVIHSRDDEIVPFQHGRRVAEAAGERAELLEISGGHNTGFLESRDTYVAGLERFLERCAGSR